MPNPVRFLSWLFDDEASASVRQSLSDAGTVVASDLTLVECDRVLVRSVYIRRLSEASAADRSARMRQAADRWILFHIDEEILDRTRRPFPVEPLRTLDAIHLATALVARRVLQEIAILSFDQRVRSNARRLGLMPLPVGRV